VQHLHGAHPVTSIVSRDGGTDAASSILEIHRGSSRSDSSRADTLTAIDRSCPPARNSASVASADSIALRDIAAITPVFSASGMKTSGEITPCAGCRQRMSASIATTEPLVVSTCGW
jgi:hypothetical protein